MTACQTYFDWHPLTGGLALLAASAIAVTALLSLLDGIVPAAEGWPIVTPLNGAMLAVLLISRRKLWPFLLLGYAFALFGGSTLAGAAHRPGGFEVLGGVAEILLAAMTLPPYRNLKQWLQEPRLLRAFTGYAVLLGPAVSLRFR